MLAFVAKDKLQLCNFHGTIELDLPLLAQVGKHQCMGWWNVNNLISCSEMYVYIHNINITLHII